MRVFGKKVEKGKDKEREKLKTLNMACVMLYTASSFSTLHLISQKKLRRTRSFVKKTLGNATVAQKLRSP